MFFFLIVDGNYGPWSKWSTCSKTCKEGRQSRTRECNSPAPQYGGMNCTGDSNQSQVCNRDIPCPGIRKVMWLIYVVQMLEIDTVPCIVYLVPSILIKRSKATTITTTRMKSLKLSCWVE